MSGKLDLTTPGYLHRGLDELFRMAQASPIEPTCSTFYFLRHGETEGNHKKIFQRADQPLNDRGIEQAHAAATVLRSHKIERIVASTMDRAWVTAEIAGKPHGLAPEPEDGLRERWFGDLVGTPSHDHDWREDPPNGETLATFVTRTQAGIRRALERAHTKHTLLVGHGGILYVLAPSLGLGLSTELLANATPIRLDRTGSAWKMTRLADIGAKGDNVA